jgi:putative SOS response-associated peptidase YedK
MCGKFTALASWREIVEYSQAFTEGGGDGDGGGDDAADEIATYRVGGLLPVIIWDADQRQRRIVNMRWSFPDPKDWRRPKHIHARSETIDVREAFRPAFLAGQTGIVVFRTFNERKDIVRPSGKTDGEQWTIDPMDGQPRGFAFLWQRFEIADQPAPMLACVMITTPANELIRRTIKAEEDDPRMPAILEDGGWAPWLGEAAATPTERKALLRTMEGVNWQAAPEPKKPRPRKR